MSLQCPECGKNDSLCRVEALRAYPGIYVEKDGTWSYNSEGHPDWNTQNRELLEHEPEFFCMECSHHFDHPSKKKPGIAELAVKVNEFWEVINASPEDQAEAQWERTFENTGAELKSALARFGI
jgi:hypothetical protein